jgi:Sulfotransferase family
MQRFIIAGTQRTGTSLIESTLNSHSDIRCLGEVFLFRRGRGKFIEASYRQFVDQRRFARSIAHYTDRRRLVKEYLDEFYQVSNMRATGFKFMLSQANQFPDAIRYLQENKIRVLHVVRDNALKTLVSRISARSRKLYHSIEDIEVDKVYLPPRRLLKSLAQILDESERWKHLAAENPYLKISYESFLDDRDQVLKSMLNFLGVEYATSMSSDLKKINSDNLSDVVVNYAEVTRILTGTRYEIFLS